MIKDKFIKNPYFLWVGVVSMSVKEVSLYFLGGVPFQYFGLDPIDPRSSFIYFQDIEIGWVLPALKHNFMDILFWKQILDLPIKMSENL